MATRCNGGRLAKTFGTARERVVGGSVTQDTIPNLTPGTQYFVRVIATGTGTGDGTPSNVESGTPLAAVNQPPETTSQIAMQFLEVGGSVRIGLSNHFRDPEGRTMTFRAVSDNTRTTTASVQGSVLTIRGVARGGASVTVTARDSGGLTATQSFRAMVGRVAFFATTSASAPEGGTARLTVRLSRASNASTSLDYVFGSDGNPNTSDANAADYQGTGGTVAIPAGQTEELIEITIRDDIDIEPAREVFTVGLAVPAEHQNDVALGAATATVTIDEGVCDRTPEVRDVLRGAAACSAVSTAALDRRESLVLANMGIDALQPNDFDLSAAHAQPGYQWQPLANVAFGSGFGTRKSRDLEVGRQLAYRTDAPAHWRIFMAFGNYAWTATVSKRSRTACSTAFRA